MKIRTVRYILKEGLVNTYKNKLMTLAAVIIVTASLIILGVFLLFVVNLNYNTALFRQMPELVAFCHEELDEVQAEKVRQDMLANGEVRECIRMSKKDAFEKMKKLLGEDVLAGFDESVMEVSFIIKLKDPEKGPEVAEQLAAIPGVRKVSYSRELSDLISRMAKWVNIISGILVFILMAFAVSIIANTIKLTVFTRKKEINIMKYIGATDWFIRWPFIVEGVVIGLMGSAIAFLITRFGYTALESRFNGDIGSISANFIRLVKMSELNYLIMLNFSLVGGVVGAIGSAISIRKHLQV